MKDVLGPDGEAELGRHERHGTTSVVEGDREGGLRFLGFGEPLDRAESATY